MTRQSVHHVWPVKALGMLQVATDVGSVLETHFRLAVFAYLASYQKFQSQVIPTAARPGVYQVPLVQMLMVRALVSTIVLRVQQGK